MASDSEYDADYLDEITAVNNQFSVVTLTSPPPLSCDAQPLPTLPFDLIAEILCKLPVKLLLQLRCECKFLNRLISDPKFAQKHLTMSTTSCLHFVGHVGNTKYVITSYPLHSLFTKVITRFTLFEYSPTTFDGDHCMRYTEFIGSCNGILCIADHYGGLVILCNPFIRKFKELPLFEKPKSPKSPVMNLETNFGFGYDSFANIYKVVVVFLYVIFDSNRNCVNKTENKTEVKVYTLGTDFWRSIQDFPFGVFPINSSGIFVSGRINWLASTTGYQQSPFLIVSLDLAKESYQEVMLPDYGKVGKDNFLTLHVLRDCLCTIFHRLDVWIMKEYGNKESWTKLFTVSDMQDPSKSYALTKAVYIFDDDHQVLLESKGNWDVKLIVYNSRNNTFNSTKFLPNIHCFMRDPPEVCVESLVLPWSEC